MKAVSSRRWEIDCLRGAAVGLMLISNFLFDLYFFVGNEAVQSSGLDWFARFIAGFFIFLAGLSLYLSQVRIGSRFAGFTRIFRRGLGLIALGMVVSAATLYAAGDGLVIFGVLHLIGLGLILSYPFVRHPIVSLVAGLLVFAATPLIHRVQIDTLWLIWLGIQPRDFSSVDYAPLIPWLGPMLIGIFAGHTLYPGGEPRKPLPDLALAWPVRPLAWAGRHSLVIYFVHQPFFLGGLFLVWGW